MICPFLQSFRPMRAAAQMLQSFGLVGALMLHRGLVAPFRIGDVASLFRYRKSDLDTKGVSCVCHDNSSTISQRCVNNRYASSS